VQRRRTTDPVKDWASQQLRQFGDIGRNPPRLVLGEQLGGRSRGLISYGPNYPDQFRRAAGYVDRILRGEKPADLPVQAPTKYELIINLKTAKALGLSVPTGLLNAADEVIE